MKTECSICKQEREIVYQSNGNHYCDSCWFVVNAPYEELLKQGIKYKNN